MNIFANGRAFGITQPSSNNNKDPSESTDRRISTPVITNPSFVIWNDWELLHEKYFNVRNFEFSEFISCLHKDKGELTSVYTPESRSFKSLKLIKFN